MNALDRYNEAKRRQLELAEDRFKAFVIQLSNAIIKGTPVDTGRASSNWYADVNTTSIEKSDTTSQSESMNRVVIKGESLTLNDTYTITNNLDYINALEYGHSKRAPNGMVRINVRKLSAEYRRKWGL